MIQIGLLIGVLTSISSGASGADPAAMIECRSDMAGYQAFVEETAAEVPLAGWTKVKGSNPFLTEYRLDRPVTVFGRATSRVAFAGSGVLALFENVDVKEIAGRLGVANDFGGRSKFLGEKILQSTVEEDKALSSRFTTVVALTVSTVDTHPGVVFAGCSYRVDVESL